MRQLAGRIERSEVCGCDAACTGRLMGDVAELPIPSIAGLSFINPLGLAAGFDRTGANVPSLAPFGFGHIEIGTVTSVAELSLPVEPSTGVIRIGINIASARLGFGSDVIADYEALLADVWSRADYVTLNLSSQVYNRGSNNAWCEALIRRTKHLQSNLVRQDGHYKPVFVKVRAGPAGTEFPRAIAAARDYGLDGVVLVTDNLERLAAICARLGGRTRVISVGGISTSYDVRARISAGAALVQVYTAMATSDGPRIRQMLNELNEGRGT